jgi:hypothetical protein
MVPRKIDARFGKIKDELHRKYTAGQYRKRDQRFFS